LASQEGLFSVILVVIHCNDLTVTLLKMYKVAVVLSALMKMYTIPCHNRGHINGMLILQSCADSLQIQPGSSRGTFPTSSDDECNFSKTEVEEDIDVKGEGFIAIKEEMDIKSDPGEVSYMSRVCC